MPLNIPQLDDRSYQDLLTASLDSIRRDLNTDWNDLSAGDPGVVLLEAFAFLTEQMLYRLNRLPEKAYIAFLNLLGVSLDPPTVARVRLRFERAQAMAGSKILLVPAGTRIVPGSGSDDKLANAFVLAKDLEIPAKTDGPSVVQGLAYHCEQLEEELGISNGLPGQSFTVQRPPMVAPLGNSLDMIVGVEVQVPHEEQRPDDKTGSDGRVYRPWQEVERFTDGDSKNTVYSVDRILGLIQFAPAFKKKSTENVKQAVTSLGAVPVAGRHIHIWYSRGGGETGNLQPGVLNEILDPPSDLQEAGITVTNPQRAWGGADGEALANALVRGPHEFFSRGNVVTATDYEQLVLRHSRWIARTKAYARSAMWNYAQPGTVEVVLLPSLSADERKTVTLEILKSKEQDERLLFIQNELDEKSLLGTRCGLVWARYKKVWVEADLMISSNADSQQVQKNIVDGLNSLISPFPTESQNGSGNAMGVLKSGWPFGQELRLAQVYQYVLTSEPNITLIRRLVLKIDEAPDRDVRCLTADNFQPETWYAASARRLFRSTNNGLGWEKVLDFDPEAGEAGRLYLSSVENDRPTWSQTKERRQEIVTVIRASPGQPGVVAVATHLETDSGSAVNREASALYASANCGETWYCIISHFDGEIEDMAWLIRNNRNILLLATTTGLYELDVVFQVSGELDLASGGEPPAGPSPDEKVVIMPFLAPVQAVHPTMPLSAVTVISNRRNARVAVAAKNRQGIWLSRSDDLIPVERKSDQTNQMDDNPASNFEYLGLSGEDVRHLNVQKYQSDTYLWAAAMAVGDVAHGCYRWKFEQNLQLVQGEPEPASTGWTGGSCYTLTFQGEKVLAATAWGGILSAEIDSKSGQLTPWQAITGSEFLPRHIRKLDQAPASGDFNAIQGGQDRGYFLPLFALASNDSARAVTQSMLMTGGRDGVYRLIQGEPIFEEASRTEFSILRDAVTLPKNWLFVCGEHVVNVSNENAQSNAVE